MKIGAPKETYEGEKRVALTPQSAQALKKLGYDCVIESGAGEAARFSDAAYGEAGVEVVPTAAELWAEADVVAKVRAPEPAEIELRPLRPDPDQLHLPGAEPRPARGAEGQGRHRDRHGHGAAHQPRAEDGRAVARWPTSPATARSSRRATTSAASSPARSPPPARCRPAKVLVIGAGVAGLAAIGTAAALGAITYAFDVRPEVAEQIESMGAEFVFLEFEEAQDGAATGGYAAPSSPEFREKQLAQVPRARARDRHRHHHRADPRPPRAEALDRGHGRGDEARLGRRRPRRRARRQLRPDRARPGDRDRERRQDHRLHRLPQPHGDPGLDALLHQHPPHDGRPDARPRTGSRSSTWRTT